MAEGMEPSYRRHAKHEKTMCKHCKSTAHGTLEHKKHYKGFQAEKKDARMAKHMKMFEQGPRDNDKGVKEGSKADLARDAKEKNHKKAYSESDMGSMKGYDPTGGLGNKMQNSMGKGTGKAAGKMASAQSRSYARGPINQYDGGGAVGPNYTGSRGSTTPGMRALGGIGQSVNTARKAMPKKHSKKV